MAKGAIGNAKKKYVRFHAISLNLLQWEQREWWERWKTKQEPEQVRSVTAAEI